MSAAHANQRPALDSIKETPRMPKRLASLAALIGAAFLLLVIPSVASAAPPWWQILDGSRPSNLWASSDTVQEIETELTSSVAPPESIMVGKIEVGGNVVGCLGTSGPSNVGFCFGLTGFPPTSTAAELEALLKSAYGTDALQVSGGPVGGDPFLVTFFGKSVPSVKINTEGAPGFFIGKATVNVLSPGGSGRLVLAITNLGDTAVDATETPVTITDQMPEGAVATGVEASAGYLDEYGPVDCAVEAADLVSCSFEGTLPPYEAIEIDVGVDLTGNPPAAGAPGKVTVSGGNASPASIAQKIEVSPEQTPFGVERFSAQVEEEGGDPATQAGKHPFQLTTTIQLNAGAYKAAAARRDSTIDQPAVPRNLHFPLPAGFIGNATAMPQCRTSDFFEKPEEGSCPADTALGVSSVTIVEKLALGFARLAVPVFNLPPKHGEPARFGFNVLGVPVLIGTELHPEDEYRIVASVRNVTQVAKLLSSTTVLWGNPGDPRHDSSRGWGCFPILGAATPQPCERPPGLSEDAFLRQPVSCDGPLDFNVAVEPWNVPLGSVIDRASFAAAGLHGCNRVPFDPKIEAAPSAKLAESSSGLSFKLNMPNSGLLNGEAIAEGQPKKVKVTLPEGMTVNPSAAEGLAVCTPADYARERYDSKPGEGCPDASKIGSVEIDTPLIEENPVGALYQAAPHDNPTNSLLGLYIVARVPERGILVKLAGKVEPDPKTGQLITTFDNAPQLPFSSFDLNFREGGRAPLVTPPACGSYDIVARFTPWSAKDPNNPLPSEIVTRKSTFTVQRGVDGGACPSGGVPPFNPGFEAGSMNNDAKAYTPFYMRLTREDGEQNMTKFSSILPPGVLGKLAGVDKCSDAAIEAAKTRNGKDELASPSCPANSQIGRVSAGAGVGSILTYVGGKIYLAGPYKGAPLSVVVITPAVAGPFDVGTVVVREGLTLNPKTAEVEVDGASSDPIPHILAGIPLKVRDLRVYVDRDKFIINPTSCDEESTKATLFGSFLDLFSSADDVPAALSSRYQAANCANLGFKPRLNLKLTGGTRRGAHPGLRATYVPRPNDANVQNVVVRLPRSAFLEQGHIRTICTRVQFAADNCPKGAQYGYIRAFTPLLDEPLQGPVWLRSSNNKLPDLVFDLKGIVDVEVATRIDSVRGGIRASVETAPDAPLSKVVLTMQGGKKGLIVNSTNLCKGRNRAEASFTGHNGKAHRARPVVKPVGCGKVRKGKKRRR